MLHDSPTVRRGFQRHAICRSEETPGEVREEIPREHNVAFANCRPVAIENAVCDLLLVDIESDVANGRIIDRCRVNHRCWLLACRTGFRQRRSILR